MNRAPRTLRFAAQVMAAHHPPNALFIWAEKLIFRRSPSLSAIPVEEVRDLLREGGLHRALVIRWAPPGTTAQAVIEAVDRPWLVGPAAMLLGTMPLAAGALSQALFEVIASAAGNARQAETAFQAVRRTPERILAKHRAGIFGRAWLFARQPIDPYSPNALHDAARGAAAALLTEHDDVRALGRKDLAAGHGRQLRLVYAAAVQGMEGALGEEFAAVLDAVRPDGSAAVAFARDCDRDYSVTDPLDVQGEEAVVTRVTLWVRGLRHRLTRWVPVALATLGVPAGTVGAAFVLDAIWRLPHHVTIAVPPVLTIAGVLVAIHVVAAELAADRLPGLVARATSVPLPLWAGYGGLAALLVVAALKPSPRDLATYSVISLGLVASLVISLALALQRLLSRTDSSVAARIFASAELARARRAGRRVGRLHQSILRMRSSMTALAWVRPSMSPPLSLRRRQMQVDGRGYLVLHERRLAKLDRSGWWKRGGRLWVYGVLGGQFEAGDEVASVVVPPEDTLLAVTVRDVLELFVVRRIAAAERVAEGVSDLVALTARLAQEGNEPGASHVASDAVRLLRTHTEALHRVRGSLGLGDGGAPLVVSRAAALSIARELERVRHPAAREALTTLAQRCLPGCRRGDTFLPILIGQLGEFGPDRGDPELAELLLEDCGRRALELRDDLLARVWWRAERALEANPGRRDSVIQVGTSFVQYASLVDNYAGERAWAELEQRLSPTSGRDQLAAIRVGATTLAAGHLSLATIIALWLKPSANWKSLETYLQRPRVIDREETYDGTRGHLLGTDVAGALEDFIRLGEATQRNVR